MRLASRLARQLVTTTCSPARAKVSATARPMPVAPPVTTTVRKATSFRLKVSGLDAATAGPVPDLETARSPQGGGRGGLDRCGEGVEGGGVQPPVLPVQGYI